MSSIDNSYHKEKLLDWELKSLTEKYADFSFSKKSTWFNLGLILLIMAISAFIFPFIPPRRDASNWSPPENLEEYLYLLIFYLLTSAVMILVIFLMLSIRNKIDLQSGFKWAGNFKMTRIFSFNFNLLDSFGPKSNKILILNGWRLFIIKPKQQYYNTVKKGQIISIKRTITFRLIDYYIRDEEKTILFKGQSPGDSG